MLSWKHTVVLLTVVVVMVSASVFGFIVPVEPPQERFLESVEERILSSRADIAFMKLNEMQGSERYYTELEILVGNYELRDSLRGFN